MDHWYDDQAFIEDGHATGRVLTSSSGNAQPFLTGISSNEAKREPFIHRVSARSAVQLGTLPPPSSTLHSNNHARMRQKLTSRRIYQRMKIAQVYLSHPAYIKYCQRPRKDMDKQHNIIWTDPVEVAFQNALINIPPMGKRKKSQHGRPYGRNELICEWIYRETGLKRKRKQISSHVQVFDDLFKKNAVPQCVSQGPLQSVVEANTGTGRMLNKLTTDNDLADHTLNEYYNNSIEVMVRNFQRLKQEPFNGHVENDKALRYLTLDNDQGSAERRRVNRLNFEMWVSLPHSMDVPLHKYTSLQSDFASGNSSPLEDVDGWRTSWPDLPAVIESMQTMDDFDVILLECSLRLMNDFPPESSKLGISLGIEYAQPQRLSAHDWNCITRVYQHGKFFRESSGRCPVSEPDCVKPPFESRWWAHEFIRLTDQRRQAQDVKSDAAVAAADESARNFLHSLSMMQQISVSPPSSESEDSMWEEDQPYHKRTTILLWRFSQAPNGFVGTTTWQKLIPPPQRSTTNSPLLMDASLPPLNMDTIMQGHMDLDWIESKQVPDYRMPQVITAYPDIEEELCQDGFMVLAQQGGLQVHESFDSGMAYNADGPTTFNNISSFDFSLAPNSVSEADSHGYAIGQPIYPDNLFEHQDGLRAQSALSAQQSTKGGVQIGENNDLDGLRQPLIAFDTRTHDVLQQQLAQMSQIYTMEAQSRAVDQPASQRSVLSLLPKGDASHEASDEEFEPATHTDPHSHLPVDEPQHRRPVTPEMTFPAPVAIRPPLQHHHSHSGVFHLGIGFDPNVTPRQNFVQLLESMENQYEGIFDSEHLDLIVTPDKMDRPHSQPIMQNRVVELPDSPEPELDIQEGYAEVKLEDITMQ